MAEPFIVEVNDAPDAYQLARRGTSTTPPFEGTRDEWLLSLASKEPGPPGDTSVAEALAQSAKEEADAAKALISTGANQVTASLLAAQNAEAIAESIQQSQVGGYIGFALLSDLNANLGYQEGTLASVTNDPIQSNNRVFRKIGAVGAGSWVVAANDPTGRLVNVENKTSAFSLIRDAIIEDGETFTWAWRGLNRRAGGGVKPNGQLKLYLPLDAPVQPEISVRFDGLEAAVIDKLGRSEFPASSNISVRTDRPGWSHSWENTSGYQAGGIKDDGTTIWWKMELVDRNIPNGLLTDRMLGDELKSAILPALDFASSMPDDVRPQKVSIGAGIRGGWEVFPRRKTPVLWGVNNSGVSLRVRKTSGLLVRGKRRAGSFSPVVDSVRLVSNITTTSVWPPSDPQEGDYHEFISAGTRTLEGVTLNQGDKLVYSSGAWIRQPRPGSPFLYDFYTVEAAGVFSGVSLQVGDRLVFMGRTTSSGLGPTRWKRLRVEDGEFCYQGRFNPGSGIPTTVEPSDGDLWEASVSGTAGGFDFDQGDYLVRIDGLWSRIACDAFRVFAAGEMMHLSCAQDAAEWEVAQDATSSTIVYLSLNSRGRRIPAAGDGGVQGIGDSMMAALSGSLTAALAPRAVHVSGNGGATSENIAAIAQWLAEGEDTIAGKIIVSFQGQNSLANPPAIYEAAERIAGVALTGRARCLHLSVLGQRGMTWNGSRLVSERHEDSNNVVQQVRRYFREAWSGQWLDTQATLCAAATDLPDLQFPGMTEREVADAYSIPPFSFFFRFYEVPWTANDLTFIGYHSAAGLPTDGSNGDYYVRTGGGAVGNLLVRWAGSWAEHSYDITHVYGDANVALAAAIKNYFTNQNW